MRQIPHKMRWFGLAPETTHFILWFLSHGEGSSGAGGLAPPSFTNIASGVVNLADWLSTLNGPQREAVCYRGTQHCLILAGAGSGKTRVISCRIAYLLEELGLAPWHILAISFTNKAAAQMRERTQALLQDDEQGVGGLTMSTFHAYGAQFLRIYGEELGLGPNFSIYDEGEQATVVRRLVKESPGILDAGSAKKYAGKFSYFKDHGLSESEVRAQAMGREDEEIALLFERYNRQMRALNAVDFGDLILLPIQALRSNAQLLERVRARYRVILVDEFQDANATQLKLLGLLCGPQTQLVVVGDDDQAIYTWRGSDPKGILLFAEQFGGCETFRLEQNYRSTKPILEAAATLISHNTKRHEKTLWTAREGGELVWMRGYRNDREEAQDVVRSILGLRDRYALKDFLILVRTNNQTRLFEEGARINGLKYQIVGGLGFYERAVIKDLVSYLRILVNPSDILALERIINVPKRGLGAKSFEQLRAVLQERQSSSTSPWDALLEVLGDVAAGRIKLGTSKARTACGQLHKLFLGTKDFRNGKVSELLQYIVDECGYAAYLKESKPEDFEASWLLVSELIHSVDAITQGETGTDGLVAFLENVALVRPESDPGEDSIKIMTIHAAKGLEFAVVYLTGMEEDLLPLSRGGEMDLEEERRLSYVAMTRAKERLFLSYASERWHYNRPSYATPSRFLSEIYQGAMQALRIDGNYLTDSREHSFVTETGDFASMPQAKWERWEQKQNTRAAKKRRAASKKFEAQPESNYIDDLHFADPIPDIDQCTQDPGAYDFSDIPETFRVGQRVLHARYGEGRVLSSEVSSQGNKVRVSFLGGKEKTIMGQFLKKA